MDEVQTIPPDLHTALGHTLSIATATTEEQLLRRTLDAAREVIPADVAVALTPTPVVSGDLALATGLIAAARRARARRRSGLTAAYAPAGLPSAIVVTLGDLPVIVASSVPERLTIEHGSVLALLVAHANAARDRLRELALLALRAECDPLTGLRHQRPFEQRLSASSPGRTAVIAVDVDDFKKINDSHGHQAGDLALLSLADALRTTVRDDDKLFRIGGDEFAVVMDVHGTVEIDRIARRLLAAARRVGQTISVGAALQEPGETGRETLLRADKALYQAKRAGRNTSRLAA